MASHLSFHASSIFHQHIIRHHAAPQKVMRDFKKRARAPLRFDTFLQNTPFALGESRADRRFEESG